MRVKVGPKEWRELGPGTAIRGVALGASPSIDARPIGRMIPDATTGPIVIGRSDGTNKLGIAKRWNGAARP